MKDIRQGNDIGVIWSILQEEKPLNLGSYHLSLYLTSSFGKERITDFKADGNVISWTFFGKNQRHKGTYSLTLVLNEGQENMHTIDACDFIKLVSCTCKLTDGVDKEGIETEVLKLESTVDFYAQTTITIEIDSELSETSENPVQNKAVTSAINAKQDTLVSGENIKTINGESILGGGNIVIEGGSAAPDWDAQKGEAGYIENRTHYTTGISIGTTDYTFIEGIPKRFDPDSGIYYSSEEIHIQYNEDDYVGIIKIPVNTPLGYDMIGTRFSIIGEDHGEEFTFSSYSDMGDIYFKVEDPNYGTDFRVLLYTPLKDNFIPDSIARKQELTELSEGIALRNVGAEDTDESVDEPDLPTPSASNEWKCVYDGRFDIGLNKLEFSTLADGTPLKAEEVIVQVLMDANSTAATQGYVTIHSTNNATEAMFGALYFEKTDVGTTPQLCQIRFKASPVHMIAEMYDSLRPLIAQGANCQGRLGNKIPPQVYEDITYIKVLPNTAIQSAAPLIKIYAR